MEPREAIEQTLRAGVERMVDELVEALLQAGVDRPTSPLGL